MGLSNIVPMAAATLLAAGGMATAAYATTGSYVVSTSDGVVRSDGWYNFNVKDPSRAGHYMTHVNGGLYISGKNHGYFQTRSDSYPYRTVTGFNGPGRRNVDTYVKAGDVYKANSISVRVCRTIAGPDRCTAKRIYR